MLLINTCRGEYASNDVIMSEADLTALKAIMEGKISIMEEKSVGGTDCPTPSKLRTFKLGVSRKIDKLGCTCTIKHTKATKNEDDITGHKAIFDANFETSLKATGLRVVYQGLI
jgi:hypothetical protein